MRLSRFFLSMALITSFSLLYVWQQTEIFRLAYVGQKSQSQAEDLLDSNARLKYNIDKNASLVSIGQKFPETKSFQMPDSYRLVRLAPAGSRTAVASSGVRQSLAYRIFGIKRQAEAKTINP